MLYKSKNPVLHPDHHYLLDLSLCRMLFLLHQVVLYLPHQEEQLNPRMSKMMMKKRWNLFQMFPRKEMMELY
jgi:hypothetical protein